VAVGPGAVTMEIVTTTSMVVSPGLAGSKVDVAVGVGVSWPVAVSLDDVASTAVVTPEAMVMATSSLDVAVGVGVGAKCSVTVGLSVVTLGVNRASGVLPAPRVAVTKGAMVIATSSLGVAVGVSVGARCSVTVGPSVVTPGINGASAVLPAPCVAIVPGAMVMATSSVGMAVGMAVGPRCFVTVGPGTIAIGVLTTPNVVSKTSDAATPGAVVTMSFVGVAVGVRLILGVSCSVPVPAGVVASGVVSPDFVAVTPGAMVMALS